MRPTYESLGERGSPRPAVRPKPKPQPKSPAGNSPAVPAKKQAMMPPKPAMKPVIPGRPSNVNQTSVEVMKGVCHY